MIREVNNIHKEPAVLSLKKFHLSSYSFISKIFKMFQLYFEEFIRKALVQYQEISFLEDAYPQELLIKIEVKNGKE